ncbi:hypothetical protein [Deinococcus aluminii]|uniref:Uncharacterized protein n=1 Tax=Deinococcus aluminii TaxID=1656885 RepID=A0ABP9XEU1_9DEIO
MLNPPYIHLVVIDEEHGQPDAEAHTTGQAALAALARRSFDEVMGRRDAGQYPQLFRALRAAVDGPDEAFAAAVNAAREAEGPALEEDLNFYSRVQTVPLQGPEHPAPHALYATDLWKNLEDDLMQLLHEAPVPSDPAALAR